MYLIPKVRRHSKSDKKLGLFQSDWGTHFEVLRLLHKSYKIDFTKSFLAVRVFKNQYKTVNKYKQAQVTACQGTEKNLWK